MTNGEFIDCLVWLSDKMDEYENAESHQYDYKIVSLIWSDMRGRVPENKGNLEWL